MRIVWEKLRAGHVTMRRALGSLRVEELVGIHRPDDGAWGLTELVGTLIGINVSFEDIIAISFAVLMIMEAFRRRRCDIL